MRHIYKDIKKREHAPAFLFHWVPGLRAGLFYDKQ